MSNIYIITGMLQNIRLLDLRPRQTTPPKLEFFKHPVYHRFFRVPLAVQGHNPGSLLKLMILESSSTCSHSRFTFRPAPNQNNIEPPHCLVCTLLFRSAGLVLKLYKDFGCHLESHRQNRQNSKKKKPGREFF